jgi:hypothetical protein
MQLIIMLMHVLQLLCSAIPRSRMLIADIASVSNLLLSLCSVCHFEKGKYHDLNVRYPSYCRNQSTPSK